jgi:hypothetical protein
MQQFVVPQFIEVEDKIFGPITIRQFLILLGAFVLIFLGWRFGDFLTFVLTFLIVGGLAVVFAFVKVNGQVFHIFVLNVLNNLRRPSLRVWRVSYTNQELDFLRKLGTEEKIVETSLQKKARQGHVRDLSLIVNTGGYYKGGNEEDF